MLRCLLILLILLSVNAVAEAQQSYVVKSNCLSRWKANGKGKPAGQLLTGDTIRQYYRDQNWVVFVDKDRKKKFIQVQYLSPIENIVIPVVNIQQVKEEDKPDMSEWSFSYLFFVTIKKFLTGFLCVLLILLIIHYLF